MRNHERPIRFEKCCDILVFMVNNVDANNKILAKTIRKILGVELGNFSGVIKLLVYHELVTKVKNGRMITLRIVSKKAH